MDFFSSPFFYDLYKKSYNRTIESLDDTPYAQIKNSFPSFCEIGANGTKVDNRILTELNLQKSLKKTSVTYFIDYQNSLKPINNYLTTFSDFSLDKVLISSDDTIDNLFSRFSKNRKRNIKKAKQNNLLFSLEKTERVVDDFIKLYHEHGEKLQYQPMSNQFIRNLVSHKLCEVFSLYSNDIMVCASISIRNHTNELYYYIPIVSNEGYALKASDLLLFHHIEYCLNNKIEVLNLGLTDINNKGLLNFKRGFNSHFEIVKRYTIYRSFFDKVLIKLRNYIKN